MLLILITLFVAFFNRSDAFFNAAFFQFQSTLNPNAAPFTMNPNAKEFVPRSNNPMKNGYSDAVEVVNGK